MFAIEYHSSQSSHPTAKGLLNQEPTCDGHVRAFMRDALAVDKSPGMNGV